MLILVVDLNKVLSPLYSGCGLNDSPVGLAAYILEKFSTWTDLKNRELEDGGLERYIPVFQSALQISFLMNQINLFTY